MLRSAGPPYATSPATTFADPMPGRDTHRDAADPAAPLPRRAPGDTDLRIFTTELIPLGRHHRDRLGAQRRRLSPGGPFPYPTQRERATGSNP